jgi:hypothetical protein
MGRIRPAADLVMLRQQLCTVAGEDVTNVVEVR